MQNSIKTLAEIEWRDAQPYASAFQDVYFSSDNGLLETEYVFLQGNHLPTRWQQLATNHLNSHTFTIAETGFGTGLNFICAAKLWLETSPSNAMLHYISVEKYPLSLQDITSALALWRALQAFNEPLLATYESLCNGLETTLLFDNRIKFSLLIGDATERLCNIHNRIDAWFLDGFSPSKNPDMWQGALFEQMTRLSNIEATFATFTSAGEVRRGLIAAGFEVTKQPGFGKKREMLTGRFLANKKAVVNNHDA